MNISSHNSDESHYTGDNCMNCHYTEGSGEGWFSLGGSAYYDTSLKLTVKAYNQNGTLVASTPIDQLGNFYTTEHIDFSKGIEIAIFDENDVFFSTMATKIYTGECNLCHDGSYEAQIGQF